MRGGPEETKQLFSCVDMEDRIPSVHPLRAVRQPVDEVLGKMSAQFATLYSCSGGPSIAPEHLLRASLVQAFFSIRSERQLVGQIDYNILFCWFVGLSMDDTVWDASTFSKNRTRLFEADVAQTFLNTLMALPQVKSLLSSEHFSVDGTLIEAWASMKSLVPKDGSGIPSGPSSTRLGRNGERNFHKEKRSNETHASTTDPDAKLFRKGDGQESRLCFMGSTLMENRNGLIVGAGVMAATETSEREAALILIDQVKPASQRITLGADKLYDAAAFITALRARKVTPHIAVNGAVSKTGKRRSTLFDGRTTQHLGYNVSQSIRKRIEEGFGWGNTIAGLRKVKLSGLAKLRGLFTFTIAAYNLINISKLMAASTLRASGPSCRWQCGTGTSST
jgi:transposase